MVSLFLWEPVLLNVIAYLIWQAWQAWLWKPVGCFPESNPSSQSDDLLSWAIEMGQTLKAVQKEGFQTCSSHPLHGLAWKTDALKCRMSEAFALTWNLVPLSQCWLTSCQWDLWKGEVGIRLVYLVTWTWMGLVCDSFKKGMIEWMSEWMSPFSTRWMLLFQLAL